MSAMRLTACALLILTLAAVGCKEEGTITVKSLKFNGVNAVDESRLREALATRTTSKLPWGKKAYFDRSRFDTDLKRLQA
jgi:outer membrane protein assembly factor BamA